MPNPPSTDHHQPLLTDTSITRDDQQQLRRYISVEIPRIYGLSSISLENSQLLAYRYQNIAAQHGISISDLYSLLSSTTTLSIPEPFHQSKTFTSIAFFVRTASFSALAATLATSWSLFNRTNWALPILGTLLFSFKLTVEGIEPLLLFVGEKVINPHQKKQYEKCGKLLFDLNLETFEILYPMLFDQNKDVLLRIPKENITSLIFTIKSILLERDLRAMIVVEAENELDPIWEHLHGPINDPEKYVTLVRIILEKQGKPLDEELAQKAFMRNLPPKEEKLATTKLIKTILPYHLTQNEIALLHDSRSVARYYVLLSLHQTFFPNQNSQQNTESIKSGFFANPTITAPSNLQARLGVPMKL